MVLLVPVRSRHRGGRFIEYGATITDLALLQQRHVGHVLVPAQGARLLRRGTFHTVQHLLKLYFHDGDRVAALGNAPLQLRLLPLVFGIVHRQVQLGQLVAELLFGLHNWLELDEYSR